MADLKKPGFLSRLAKVECSYGVLPHWEHPGVAAFVTFRLGDSLPQEKIGPLMEQMRALKAELRSVRLIHTSQIDSCLPDKSTTGKSECFDSGAGVAPRRQHEKSSAFPRVRAENDILREIKACRSDFERWLDAGLGSCLFSDPANRLVVEDALRHYDGKRYSLYAFVVMPNHVHILFMPNEGESIRGVIRDLKHFVGVKLSARKVWKGSFWQSEYWDTLIRDAVHFNRVRAYIRGNNPRIAYDAYAGV